jgi:biopolymer transport protein ExbD
MELIPHDELKPSPGFNFAPMIDFLFIMVSLFATIALSRASLFDTEVSLVKVKEGPKGHPLTAKKEIHHINLSISKTGGYRWLSEFQEYPMENIQAVQEELSRQYQIGALPHDKSQTEVLLHIDRQAPWEPVANILIAVREIGFAAHPVYELGEK